MKLLLLFFFMNVCWMTESKSGTPITLLDVYYDLTSTPNSTVITSSDVYSFKSSLFQNCNVTSAGPAVIESSFKCTSFEDQVEKLKTVAKCRLPFTTPVSKDSFIKDGVPDEQHAAGEISKFAITQLGNLQIEKKDSDNQNDTLAPTLALISLLEEFNEDGIQDNDLIASGLLPPSSTITMFRMLNLINPNAPHKDSDVRKIVIEKLVSACSIGRAKVVLMLSEICNTEFKSILVQIQKSELSDSNTKLAATNAIQALNKVGEVSLNQVGAGEKRVYSGNEGKNTQQTGTSIKKDGESVSK